MRKEEDDMDLQKQYTIGNVESDLLKLALESDNDHCRTEESIGLFKVAMQALEIAFWRDELKKIADKI